MDYRINPFINQSTARYLPSNLQSFKKNDSESAKTSIDIFIKQNNTDSLTNYESSHEIFGRSVLNAWRNFKEVFPLIDPVSAFRDVIEETHYSKASKKNISNVKLDYAA